MAKVASGQTMRSAERLLQVLKCFGEGSGSLSIGDISGRLDLAGSTVRRLLNTLEDQGFVRQDAAGYRLDTEIIRLAASALAGTSLVTAAGPILDDLRAKLNEAVQLSVRDGVHVIVLDNRQSGHLAKMFHSIGHRYPGYRGSASGKALLAWLPGPELGHLLAELLPDEKTWRSLTPRSIDDLESLRAALARTRDRGYALNDAETEPGVWSVAAPVRDHSGRVVAALNMPCPVNRLSEDRRSQIIAGVREAARALSAAAPFID